MKKKKKEDKAQKLDLLVEVSKSIEEKIHLAVRELGLYIQMHKETEDCSWEDLEDELGVSESTLQRIANGEKQVYLFTFCMLQNRLRKYGTQPFKILFSEENDNGPLEIVKPQVSFSLQGLFSSKISLTMNNSRLKKFIKFYIEDSIN